MSERTACEYWTESDKRVRSCIRQTDRRNKNSPAGEYLRSCGLRYPRYWGESAAGGDSEGASLIGASADVALHRAPANEQGQESRGTLPVGAVCGQAGARGKAEPGCVETVASAY